MRYRAGQSARRFDFDFAVGGAAPEPSTWAMMALGFAGLGFVGLSSSTKNQGSGGVMSVSGIYLIFGDMPPEIRTARHPFSPIKTLSNPSF